MACTHNWGRFTKIKIYFLLKEEEYHLILPLNISIISGSIQPIKFRISVSFTRKPPRDLLRDLKASKPVGINRKEKKRKLSPFPPTLSRLLFLSHLSSLTSILYYSLSIYNIPCLTAFSFVSFLSYSICFFLDNYQRIPPPYNFSSFDRAPIVQIGYSVLNKNNNAFFTGDRKVTFLFLSFFSFFFFFFFWLYTTINYHTIFCSL